LVKICLACAALLACAAPAAAESRVAQTLAEDAKLYVTAPIRWDGRDWLHVGETVALVAAAHQFDDDVRTHFVSGAGAPLDGRDPHSARDALPAAAVVLGTWAAAFWQQNSDGYEEGREMLEAAGFTAVTTTLVKYAARRGRPDETTDPNDWRGNGDSFPSLHTSAAFAIGTVLAESGNDRVRWLRRTIGYGLAAGTAYARMDHDAHWLSDTVAGAALGLATARFVMKQRDDDRRGRLTFAPLPDGIEVGFVVDLRR